MKGIDDVGIAPMQKVFDCLMNLETWQFGDRWQKHNSH